MNAKIFQIDEKPIMESFNEDWLDESFISNTADFISVLDRELWKESVNTFLNDMESMGARVDKENKSFVFTANAIAYIKINTLKNIESIVKSFDITKPFSALRIQIEETLQYKDGTCVYSNSHVYPIAEWYLQFLKPDITYFVGEKVIGYRY